MLADVRGSVDARLWLGLFAFLTLSYTLLLLPRDTFDTLIHEDGVVESVGAAGLLCTSIIFFIGFRRARKAEANHWITWSLLILALIFFFGAGEELSWGQRIFGWGTPAALHNGQEETTLHNIGPVQNGSRFIRTNALFAYFWFTVAFLLPIGALLSERVRRRVDGKLPIFPVLMAPLFLYNEIVSEGLERVLPDSLYHGTARIGTTVTEIRESDFAVLFAVAAFLTVTELTRRWARSGAAKSAPGEPVPESAQADPYATTAR